MLDVLDQMKNGKTRQQAAQIIGVKVSQVNNWYEKGLNNETKNHYQFYKRVNEIESSMKKLITDNESDLISEVKFTACQDIAEITSAGTSQKSDSLVAVNYCQNCGKKIYGNESNYCTNCGSSLIEIKKTYSDESNFDFRSKTTVTANNLGKCCSGLMVMFVIIAVLTVII